MKYQDTILTDEQIQFRPLPVKRIEDGKVDIVVTIPLTNLLEAQAKASFFVGITECFKWFMRSFGDNKIPTEEDVKLQLAEWGLD